LFLIDDDGVEFGSALGVDEGAPLLVDLVIRGDAVNEVQDYVLLVAQRRTGVDGCGVGARRAGTLHRLSGESFRRRAPRHEPTGQLHPARWAARGR
jgi:hypothetical protein